MKKHKKAISMLAILALTAAGCGSGADSASAEGESVTLRLGTGLSQQHAWVDTGIIEWSEKVTELTDGQVEFEIFTGGELVATPDEAEAVQNGTIDVGLILPIYSPDQFPLAEVTMLPVSHSDAEIAAEAYQSLMDSDADMGQGETFYESQFQSQGLKAWPLAPTEAYALSTTGKEINSAADVSGLSLRTPSRVLEMYSENVDIDSITMPAVEMYDAMSRGAFDGSFYSLADWSGYGFQDLFEYTLTDINFGHFNSNIAMTADTWESLSPEVQEAMEQAHEEIYSVATEEWISRSVEMRDYNEDRGGEFISFSDIPQDAQQHLNQGIESTWEDYISEMEAQGQPGRQLAVLWRDAVVDAGGEVPEGIKTLD